MPTSADALGAGVAALIPGGDGGRNTTLRGGVSKVSAHVGSTRFGGDADALDFFTAIDGAGDEPRFGVTGADCDFSATGGLPFFEEEGDVDGGADGAGDG